jgi:hypothetical protein
MSASEGASLSDVNSLYAKEDGKIHRIGKLPFNLSLAAYSNLV